MIRTRGRLWTVLPAMLVIALTAHPPAAAAEGGPNVEAAVSRGLDWLAKEQSKAGHWTTTGSGYPTAITSLAGIALLGEGSTTSQGKYAENLRRAVDYLVRNSRRDGLIARVPDRPFLFALPAPRKPAPPPAGAMPPDPAPAKPVEPPKPTEPEDSLFMFGHGYALLFLSQALPGEKDADRRDKLTDVLKRAAAYASRAQTQRGGWGYISAAEGSDFEEGAATAVVLDGLLAARDTGIEIPKDAIARAFEYLRRTTQPDGGIAYSLQAAGTGGRRPITAAAAACLQQGGAPRREHLEKLLKYCEAKVPATIDGSAGHWHFTHFYFAQVRHRQGDDAWQKYRDAVYPALAAKAGKDGAWDGQYLGPAYASAVNLTILQLQKPPAAKVPE